MGITGRLMYHFFLNILRVYQVPFPLPCLVNFDLQKTQNIPKIKPFLPHH